MSKIVFSCFLLFCAVSEVGYGKEEKDSQIAVPSDWSISDKVVGDLNGDGISDTVVILVKNRSTTDSKAIARPMPAILRIYFAEKTGELKLKTEASEAVCFQCGGLKGGDLPFSLEIKDRVLLLTWSGGSRETFQTTTKWRFQNGDFYLIGIYERVVDTIASEEGMTQSIQRDINISTRKMTEVIDRVVSGSWETEVKTKSRSQICKVPPSYKKMRLQQYFPGKFSTPKCSAAKL